MPNISIVKHSLTLTKKVPYIIKCNEIDNFGCLILDKVEEIKKEYSKNINLIENNKSKRMENII